MSRADTLNVIVVSSAPAGRFLEGVLSDEVAEDSIFPGIMMQLKAGEPEDGSGRAVWEPFNQSADGVRGLVAILREDEMQGKGPDEAYAPGKRIFLYCPIPGDELLCRVSAPGTGTSDNYAIGQKFIIDDGTGNLVAHTGTPESVPFQAYEDIDDVESTGTLVLCIFTGH